MQNLVFRDLSLEDLSNNSFWITLHSLFHPHPVLPMSLKEVQDTYYYRQHIGVRTIVCTTKEDLIVATGSIFIEPKFRGKGDKSAHIEDVAVHVDYQQNGLGKALMLELIKISEEAGCYKTTLCCSPANIGFYEKLGFHKHEYGMRREKVC